MSADYLVIGGGTAGSALAERLSADPARRVVLVEAGRDTPPGAVPADIADTFPASYSNPAYGWPGLEAASLSDAAPRPYLQARLMGGGSSLMGMWALRGLAADYEGWRERGALDWGWGDVAPRFERLRTIFPLRHVPRTDWPGYVAAFQEAAAECGYPLLSDINASESDGFYAIPLSQDGAVRASSAHCYLTSEVRRRANLQILPETEVLDLVGEGREIRGARAIRHAEPVELAAKETLLCAGAIHSPALLLRSGIGAADELRAAGVTLRAHRPGVGRNLQNHVGVNLGLTLKAAYRQHRDLRNYGVACLRMSSGLPGSDPSDLLVALIGRTAMREIGRAIALVGVFLYSPSSRGQVSLLRKGDVLATRIEFNLLETEADHARISAGVRLVMRLLRGERLRNAFHDAFLLPSVPPLHRLNRPGAWGALQSLLGQAALTGGAATRRHALGQLVGRNRIVGSGDPEAAWDKLLPLIRESAAPLFHVAGTCAMGPETDQHAVVDSQCRVHGVSGLRVVDASIMPRIPRANTFLPVAMVAERAADIILECPKR